MLLPTVIALYFDFLNIVYLISPVAPRYYFKLFSNKRPPPPLKKGGGAGTNYAATGEHTGRCVFTIVEEKAGKGSTAGWGKLKSGAGWVSLDYCTKLV